MALKTIDEMLHELMEKIADKSVAAARRINESALSVEERIAVATQLLENASVPKWLTKETMDAPTKLAVEIRESSYAFPVVKTVTKHNGVLENGHVADANVKEADAVKLRVAAAAKAAFGLSEAEAKAFAEIDDTYEALRDAIVKA